MENRRATRQKIAEEVAKEVTAAPSRKRDKIAVKELAPTGSVLLNLALSDHTEGGFQIGKMANIIGDSSSGKTFLCLSVFAESNKKSRFKKHRFIFDDAESANEFDMDRLFGAGTAKRIEPPRIVDGEDVHSDTIQDFYDHVTDAIEKGDPFIYILDSFDALDAEEDQKKIKEQKKARRSGKDASGSYGMAKPKIASSIFRDICTDLKTTESILIIISQTRDNIDPMSFAKKTRSGGNALKFYSTHEIWLANKGSIKSRNIDIGNLVKAKVSKNKLTGKHRVIEFPLYYDYGVDSIQGAVNFLVTEKHWTKTKLTIHATDLDIEGTVQKIIEQIEEKGLEDKLSGIVQKVWNNIEDSLKLQRKPKYK